MKRGAEKQLSKDDNPDDEVEEVQSGFQIAKESELARREIRGLPRRRSPAVAPAIPPPTTQPTASQKFGSFSGFGATTGGPSPFSRLGIRVQRHQKVCVFLGPSSTAGAKPVVSSETPKEDASGDTDEVALRYYTSLRGLNTSFLSAVSKALESDPFVDVADILEQYKKHRISVQQDYDGKSSHAKAQSLRVHQASLFPAAPFSLLSLLHPVRHDADTSTKLRRLRSAAAPATGFTPSPAAPTTIHLLSAIHHQHPHLLTLNLCRRPRPRPRPFLASLARQLHPPCSNQLHLKHQRSTSGTFAFGGSSGSTSLPGTSSLLFGNPPKTSTLFGSDKVAPEEKDKEKDKPASSTPPPASFSFTMTPGTNLFKDTTTGSSGSSIFGASTTMKSVEEKDNKEKDRAGPAPPSNVFGGSFGAPSKSSPFTFGSTVSAATPAQFGFGVSPGGSEKSSPPPPKAGSIGFSFGSPSRTSSQATPSTTTTGSVFGSTSTMSTSALEWRAQLLQEVQQVQPNQHPRLVGGRRIGADDVPGLHGGEGEGEEDEETTYTVKAKVFKFTTDREGSPTWSDMGIGMVRLKKHKETNTRRVILRSNTTERSSSCNFRIYPGLQPKRTGKTVAFTGHITSPGKDTQSVQYRLRVSTELIATELAEAMEREVRLVQANSSPST
ncbi:hypothetical protein BJV77DRAFT_1067629 [Russula vinacea]|nr:hypothetical protein BJV77DRAFT_1067629 [Russula vinacea]